MGLLLRPEIYVVIHERLGKDDGSHLLVTTLRTIAHRRSDESRITHNATGDSQRYGLTERP